MINMRRDKVFTESTWPEGEVPEVVADPILEGDWVVRKRIRGDDIWTRGYNPEKVSKIKYMGSDVFMEIEGDKGNNIWLIQRFDRVVPRGLTEYSTEELDTSSPQLTFNF